MALQVETMVQVVANRLRNLVFFPGTESTENDSTLCYNYKTNQWTEIPDYNGFGMFSVHSKTSHIGLVRFSSGSVDLQTQLKTHQGLTAQFETAMYRFNPTQLTEIVEARPLFAGGVATVRIGTRDARNGTILYATGHRTVSSSTETANFLGVSNYPVGRYTSVQLTWAGSAPETFFGVDLEHEPAGEYRP